MKALKIDAQSDTPKVYFEPELDLYLIEGNSLPENAIAFYQPVLEWLTEFFNPKDTKSKNFTINIKLYYYNTASSKQIIKLFGIFTDSSLKNQIKIIWHYDEEDTDMLKAGKKYERLTNIDFEYVINEE